MQLHIELAFFRDDELLCRGEVDCGAFESIRRIEDDHGHQFQITSKFDEPACPVEILCHQNEKILYKAALRVGVHTSDDWESIDLAGIHTLGFRCQELKEEAEQGGYGDAEQAV